MVAEYDYIVVGSGPGGGPLASRLALAPEGYRVALLEAGTDPAAQPGSRPFFNYSVPVLYTNASEDPDFSWEFFVKHYSSEERQRSDSKYDPREGGIFYPRAAALGGCTAHHAMISLYPNHADWEQMRDKVDADDKWSAEDMRKIFERLENCQYLPRPEPDKKNAGHHGFKGWLPLSLPDPTLLLGDDQLRQIVLRAFLKASADKYELQPGSAPDEPKEVLHKKAIAELMKEVERSAEKIAARNEALSRRILESVARVRKRLEKSVRNDADVSRLLDEYTSNLLELFRMALTYLDPNDGRPDEERVGPFNTPLSVLHGVRTGVRERILAVHAQYPERLHLFLGALVTEVLVEDGRAVGVRFLRGKGLYQATPAAQRTKQSSASEKLLLRKGGEVILAGGAFNTPQLLMLSGIGPEEHLIEKGIHVKCNLPGVGKHLQDRYEVSVVAEFPKDFTSLRDLSFRTPDPKDHLAPRATEDLGIQEWMNHRGVYASNGAVTTIIRRSAAAKTDQIPDLFIFGLPGFFKGYERGYSANTQYEKRGNRSEENHRRFSWVILKGRTRNTAGYVQLKSKDPLDRPEINFKYFDEGSPDSHLDLEALVAGVRFAVNLIKESGFAAVIKIPDEKVLTNDESLRAYIRREAWGHHACGTCAIGKEGDPNAVLDGRFRVRGVENLRVVDASVFPKIPGFFIVTAIYMISEKAADDILTYRRDKKRQPWPIRPGGG